MKNIRVLIIAGIISLITACNGGGGGSDPTPVPQPTFTPTPLPYSYTASYVVAGESYGGLPVVDIRPYASQATVTYTLTNSYESMPIWFVNSSNGYVPELSIHDIVSSNWDSSLDVGYAFEFDGWAGSCLNSTVTSPLKPGQSCTFTMHIITQWNYSESELANFAPTSKYSKGMIFTYFYQKRQSTDIGTYFPVNTYVRSGIWYRDKQGYNLGLPNGDTMASVQVVNIGGATAAGGHDYIFPEYQNNNARPFAVTFDSNGIAQVNTQSSVECSVLGVLGCQGGGIYRQDAMVNATNISYNQSSQLYLAGALNDGYNGVVTGLNKLTYGRDGESPNHFRMPNVKALYAVESNGTIIGQNNNGEYGCFDNNGDNFRAFPELPSGFSLAGENTDVSDTVSYESTNWIRLSYSGGSSLYFHEPLVKVSHEPGVCGLDFTNILFDNLANIPTGVPQTAQITPNGVYNYTTLNGGQMSFLKYPPRQ